MSRSRPAATIDAPADEAELAARLRLAITRAARRLRQEAGGDIGPSQAAALATIERHGPLAPSALAERERIRRPTATRIIAALGEAGLVQRTQNPNDRRGAVVAITGPGKALLRALRERKTAYLATRLREMDAADRATLGRAAAVLERMLEQQDEGRRR